MLSKEEIIKYVKSASRETLLKVVDKLVEMSNVQEEIIESQKSIISKLEHQNSLLKKLLDGEDKINKEEK